MNYNMIVYVKTLSGDIITTELNKNENGIQIRKRIQDLRPDFDWQRQVLIPEKNYNPNLDLTSNSLTIFELQDLSTVQNNDIIFLCILDPFTDYIRYTGSITSTVSIFEIKHNSIDSFTFFSDNRYEKNNLFFYRNQLSNQLSYTLNEWFSTMPELIKSYNKWCDDMPHKKLHDNSIHILLHLWRISN